MTVIASTNMNATTTNISKNTVLNRPPDKLSKTTGNIATFEEQIAVEGGEITPLHLLAINGNKSILQKYLSNNTYNINQVDHMGRTPLIYSVLGDQFECALMLLKAGAKIDEADIDDRTALHWACYQGNQRLVKLLLSRGANYNLQEKELRTPLHLSTIHDNIKVIQALLKYIKGKEVDTPDNNQMTALCWSVFYDRVEFTKLLLKHGASPASFDKDYRTVLHWTSANKDPTILKMLLEHNKAQLNFEDSKGQTVLHMAVGQSNYNLVEYLVSLPDTRLNHQDSLERTPLHWAAILKRAEIVKLLLQHNADYKIGDKSGIRPLHYAVQSGSLDTINAMLQSQAHVVDIQANDKRTALMWASVKGNDQIMELLLEHECSDVNAVDVNKQTALHMCMQSGHLKAVKVLINHGADVNMVDSKQHFPLFYACASGHIDIVTELIHCGSAENLADKDLEGRCPLHYAAMVDRTDIIKLLLHSQLNPNTQDNAGCPPLHIAAYGGFLHSMTALLENGASVDLQDKDRQTALHWACRSGSYDAVKLLVSRFHATVNKFNNVQLTPLDYALWEDHQDVAIFLTENNGYTGAYLREHAATKIQKVFRGFIFRKDFKKDLLRNHLEKKRFHSNLQSVGEQQELKFEKNSGEISDSKDNIKARFGWDKFRIYSSDSIEKEGSALETLLKNIQNSRQLQHERASSPSFSDRRKSSTYSTISFSTKSSVTAAERKTPSSTKISEVACSLFTLNKSAPVDVKSFLQKQAAHTDPLNLSQTSLKSVENNLQQYHNNNNNKHIKENPRKSWKRGSNELTSISPSIASSHSSSGLFLSQKQEKNNLYNYTYSRHRLNDNRSNVSSSTNSNSVFESRSGHNLKKQPTSQQNTNKPESRSPTNTQTFQKHSSNQTQKSRESRGSLTTNSIHPYEPRGSLILNTNQLLEPRASLTTGNNPAFEPRGSLTTNQLSALTTVANKHYSNHSSLTNLSTNLEAEKPWDIYRRDKKRIDLIRQKTNAAITIQIWYKYYRKKRKIPKIKRVISRQERVVSDNQEVVTCEIDITGDEISAEETSNKETYNAFRSSPKWSREQWKNSLSEINLTNQIDSLNQLANQNNPDYASQQVCSLTTENLNILNQVEHVESIDSFDSDDCSIPDHDTLEEVAALVIQLAWRKYVKNKLLENMMVRSPRNYQTSQEKKIGFTSAQSFSIDENEEYEVDDKIMSEGNRLKSLDTDRNTLYTDRSTPEPVSSPKKKELAAATSFPLMQNAYQRSMRKKRGKKFSIKKKTADVNIINIGYRQ